MAETFGRRSDSSRILAVAVVLVMATPLLSWWLIGDLSEQGGSDYMVKLPDINPVVGTAVGWASLAVFSGASFLLWRRGRHLLLDRGYWRVLSRLVAAGVLAAAGGRVVTAGVGGANIGGGFLFYVVPPVLAYLLIRARQEWVWCGRAE